MITIYGKEGCLYCAKARDLCESRGYTYQYLTMGIDYPREQFFEIFPSAKTVPQIIINDTKIGGYSELMSYIENTAFNGTGHTL
jgi:glutaredoxin